MPPYFQRELLAVTQFFLYIFLCFCDEYCTVFRDCCADYEQYCIQGVHSSSLRSLNHDLWKCHDVVGFLVPFTDSLWMISACPANWTHDEIATKCTRNLSEKSEDCQTYSAPLIDAKNNTYKNRFCATCHGVEVNTSRFSMKQSQFNLLALPN